ncbi:MAG: hypothetical protein R3F36_15640 [Candidatus Competibacteraceae bacterium]
MSAIPPHPSLQKLAAANRRRLRLLGLLFFMVMAGVLVFMMSFALTHRDMLNLLIFAVAGLVMLPGPWRWWAVCCGIWNAGKRGA